MGQLILKLQREGNLNDLFNFAAFHGYGNNKISLYEASSDGDWLTKRYMTQPEHGNYSLLIYTS